MKKKNLEFKDFFRRPHFKNGMIFHVAIYNSYLALSKSRDDYADLWKSLGCLGGFLSFLSLHG
jgi:hypothetical protein